MPTRKIETEISLGGEKQFNDAMKSCNSNLKTLRTDMAAVSSEFRKNENSVEALTAKQKILRQQYEQQREIVDALRTRLEHVTEAYGEDSAQADRLRQQLNAATIQMNKTADALEEMDDAIQEQSGFFARAKAAVSDYARVAKATGETAKQAFEVIGKAAGGLATAGGVVVGTVATIGVSALQTITGFATDAATRAKSDYDRANELAELARQAALAGNEEAAMEYLRQAEELIAGIDQDYLQLGFSLDRLSSASTSARDAVGKILLPALTDLSNQGAELLNSFARDMEAASGDTELMGQVIAQYVVEAANLIREQIPIFGQIAVDLIKGLATGLGDEANLAALLGDILGVVTYIVDTIAEYAPQLGSAASTLITTLLNFLLENAPNLLSAATEIITQLVTGLANDTPTLLASASGLITSMLSTLTEAAPALLDAGIEVVSQLITGIASDVPTLLESVGGLITVMLSKLLERAPDLLGAGMEAVGQLISGLANKVPDLLNAAAGLVTTMLTKLIEKAPDLITGGVKMIGQIIAGLAQALPDILAEIVALPGKLLASFTEADVDWKGIGTNIVNGIWDGIQDMWNQVTEWVSNAVTNLGNRVKRVLGISSPSRWYRDQIGVNMALGVGEGFESGMDRVADQMQRSLDEAAPDSNIIPFNRSLDAPAATGGSVTSFGGVTLIVNGYNVQDDAELAERIGYELQKISDQRGA